MSLAIDHLNQLASRHAAEGQPVEPIGLWVPSESVLVFRVELPRVSRRKQQEMLPWLLEDRLLSSPEDFEFILGAQLDSAANEAVSAEKTETSTLVYAIEKNSIGQWMLLAGAAAVSPERMVPDFLALPYEEGRWTVYTDEGRLLVRSGVYEGFAATLEFGWQQLELLLAQKDLATGDQRTRLSHLATSSETRIPKTLLDRLDTETGKINWAFTELPRGLNLLPPAYKPKGSSSLKPWMPAMALGTLLIVLCTLYMLVQTGSWQRDALVLEKAVAESYEALFSARLPESVSGSDFGSATHEMAKQKLALLEHQYIAGQTSPLAELGALDPEFSACSGCVLMGVDQTEAGLNIRLKDNARLKSRLDGLEGWSIDWGTTDAKGMNSVSIRRSGQ